MFKLLSANIKRLKQYITPILISTAILISICTAVGYTVSSHVYTSDVAYKDIHVGYYLPDDGDKAYNNMALNMLDVSDTITLIQVDSIDAGKELVKKGDLDYLVIIPENFFSGILDGTNPSISIVVHDSSDISAYIVNEFFFSFASYLGGAQAGIYSALDTFWEYNFDDDTIDALSDHINLVFLDRALNKNSFIEDVSATNEGSFTLSEHYLAVAVLITMMLMAFILMPFLQGCNSAVKNRLKLKHIGTAKLLVSNVICTMLALYITFIPCYVLISVLTSHINPAGLIIIFPAILVCSTIISLTASVSSNEFTGNLAMLAVTLFITYCGGGVLPLSLLPDAVRHISGFLPGEYLIDWISYALF